MRQGRPGSLDHVRRADGEHRVPPKKAVDKIFARQIFGKPKIELNLNFLKHFLEG